MFISPLSTNKLVVEDLVVFSPIVGDLDIFYIKGSLLVISFSIYFTNIDTIDRKVGLSTI